jgi:hypothetical protein
VIDRRAFIGSLALGTLAVPRAGGAQRARKVARIGILNSSGTTPTWSANPPGLGLV